jgi:hypothetical protein
MPAQSKAQRRLFALALQYKKGELLAKDISNEIKDLAKMPLKDLEDFVYTSEDGLPDKVSEDMGNVATLNPDMNVQGMGDVILPGNPGSANSFATQQVGSGDIPTGKKKKKKKKKKKLLLSFDKYIELLKLK